MARDSRPVRIELQKKRFMTKYEQNALNHVLAKFNNHIAPTNKKLKELDINVLYRDHDIDVRKSEYRKLSPSSTSINRHFNNTQNF